MSVSMSRRTLLSAAAGSVAAVAVGTEAGAAPATRTRVTPALRELEAKIRAGMARYAIPGVAVGVWHRGAEYVRGFGVTNVDDPVPVDGDTVFRVASTTKTFTGTAAMRLVERGRLDLDRTVRSYLPDFHTADRAASARVTVRELLNHSAGWLGDFFLDTGSGADALARYVEAMSVLPQLTPPGTVFAYNNAALSLAGRLIEVITGASYEEAVRTLVLDPLRLRHSAFFLDDIPGASVAVPHGVDADGKPFAAPEAFAMPRAIHPAGGLISSARDQLRWARFHLGNGRTPDGRRLLTRRSMHEMQSHPGPGGTLFVELDGFGVTWMLRPTAQGPKVVQHGGDWAGQHSGFLMVPERDFALTVLTNSEGGPLLTAELFADDWALRRFAGVRNLPAVTRPVPGAALAGYEGRYSGSQIGFEGETATVELDLVADAGGLSVRVGGQEALRLAFYRRDYVRVLDPGGTDTHFRANFVRGAGGEVAWLRYGGRLYHRGAATLRSAGTSLPLQRSTLPYPGLG
ncbi:beta-lactamase family protein [Couchioplanes caeruleus]|uniref:serine hydrolase domain-containing protein n=1 Tax=Couchioplanes caeruleus TaxID=56438 RepID=UPI0020BDF031|nr:serine hydrolase domain-containing protein [Couchioplanes caeruleus]UQU62483.1 beta-lactamase family protein [Couchioplanes caeruleus]